MRSILRTTCEILVILSLGFGSAAHAAPRPANPIVALLPGQAGPNDPAELAAFLDAFFAEQMEANHVAGAAVSVVKDGEVLFARGYGYADLASGKAVDPEATLFRIASVTKLFTWTAVMQLVEQRKLDLDANISAYLDFGIPETYPQPITLKHLMTHTSGLEERAYDEAVPSAEKPAPLGAWLATHLPARVRPPGEFAAYSNYGAALAGYIVERVSGLSYDAYLEQRIFEPLGMVHVTSRQPLPEQLTPDMSVGYGYDNGAYQPQAFAWEQPAPAGAMWASAGDMARFMIAHLQDGRYGEARILEAATAQQMHSRAFTHDAQLNGMAYGFYEMSRNGQWVIGHGGDLPPFESNLALLPDQGIGVFITTNSEGGSRIRDRLLPAFLDHYYPSPKEIAPASQASSAKALERFTGGYRSMRSSYTTFEKLTAIFGKAYSVSADDNGVLAFNYPLDTRESPRFYQVEPLVFREVGGDDLLIFREDARGRITQAFLGSLPTEALEKPPFYDTQQFNLLLLAVINLIFLSVIIVLPVRCIIRRIRGERGVQSRPARLAWWLAIILVLLSIVEGGGFVWTFFVKLDTLTQGNADWLGLLRAIPYLLTALTLGAVIFTVQAWQRKDWRVFGRVHYTLVTLAALAQLWFLYNNNLL